VQLARRKVYGVSTGGTRHIISLWGFEFCPEENKFSYPIGWVMETNDIGQYTLLSEIYNINTLSPQEVGLMSVASVSKPKRYNNSLKTLSKSFKEKFGWFFNEIKSENSPEFVKRIADNVCPPYLGLRRHDKYLIYTEWGKLRKAAYTSKKGSVIKTVQSLIRERSNYEVPKELIHRCLLAKEDTWDVSSYDIPEADELSLREYLAVAKHFGEYENVRVDCVATPSLIRKFGEYFSFPLPGSGELLSLTQNYSRSDIVSFMNEISFGGGMPIKEILGLSPKPWVPSFLPGEGTVVLCPDYLPFPVRVKEETYFAVVEDYLETTPLICYAIDKGELSISDAIRLSEEYLWAFRDALEVKKGKYILDELNPKESADTVESDPAQGPYSLNADGTYGNEDQLKYVQWQIQGVLNRLDLQLEPEMRPGGREHTIATELFGSNEDEVDVWDGSDDDALGDMFG